MRFAIVVVAVSIAGVLDPTLAVGQSLYKYRGPDGEWVFTDREPEATENIEVRTLSRGAQDPRVSVQHKETETGVALYARNEFFAPVQVVLGIEDIDGFVSPDAEQSLRFVVPPQSDGFFLMDLDAVDQAQERSLRYRYAYVLGDPAAEHRPSTAYRAPYAVAGNYVVSQAYPQAITHTTPDSRYAVDFAMPIGTDVYAARGGVVIEVASTNYKAGTDPSDEGAQANLVSILHEDGTYAVYAHLNWNSIRVRPGERVSRGQYIADSGNTGFSTGPHLHFVVLRNADLRSESVPVEFEGPNGAGIGPETGQSLTAY